MAINKVAKETSLSIEAQKSVDKAGAPVYSKYLSKILEMM